MRGWDLDRATRAYMEALARARGECSQSKWKRLVALQKTLSHIGDDGEGLPLRELLRARELVAQSRALIEQSQELIERSARVASLTNRLGANLDRLGSRVGLGSGDGADGEARIAPEPERDAAVVASRDVQHAEREGALYEGTDGAPHEPEVPVTRL